MGLTTRLHATTALAFYAIFPPSSVVVSPKVNTRVGSGPYTISPAEIADTLATLPLFISRDGMLSLLFSDAIGIAAPFLLFRLKRSGYSACTVVQEARGLLLTARR
jgi:hypothetical protein